jgi:hypothetical protein
VEHASLILFAAKRRRLAGSVLGLESGLGRPGNGKKISVPIDSCWTAKGATKVGYLHDSEILHYA